MELDELKNTWTVLEEQLKKNETLNKQILQEMFHKKSSKSLNRLINSDLVGVLMSLLCIPFFVWLYNANFFYHFLSVKILSIASISVCVLGIIWGFYKLKYLMKMDFSKNVKDNIYCVNKYNIMLKKEKTAGYFIVGPVLSFLIAFCYYEFKATFSLWIFLLIVVITMFVIIYWMYKKLYDSNVQSIMRSLDELGELKEE